MAVHYNDQREMISLRLKLCRAGFAGIYKNDLVDARVYDEAELFEPQAVEEIIKDLEAELIIIGIKEESDEEAIKQSKINDFYALLEQTKKFKGDVEEFRYPYDAKIRAIEKERDDLTWPLFSIIKVNEKNLIETCPHIEIKVRRESVEGDYLNCGSHTKIWTCDYCGKELDRSSKSTGHS